MRLKSWWFGMQSSQRVALSFAVILIGLTVVAWASGTDLLHLFGATLRR